MSESEPSGNIPNQQKRGIRFWLIIVSLAITALLAALEATIVSTALPSIVSDLGGYGAYVWVIMAFFLTTTAFQPLYGQLADIFGRRYPTIFAVAIFALGCGLCGGAHNIGMMIAGRTIQGIGASGINVLSELIICDLVPLRERGNFMAIIFATMTVGTAIGPVIAGFIVEYSNWRWVFYLNLPVAGFVLALHIAFLQVKSSRKRSILESLKRIDFIGNALFIAASVSVLIALGWAGSSYPWSSSHVIAPLIVGFVGLAVFLVYEGSRFAVEPTVPLRLFGNRTSLVAFILTFLVGLVTIMVIYFLPVYFQAVLMSSPARSGVQLLPTVVVVTPLAGIGGGVLARYGQYIPLHLGGFALMIIGLGLFTLLDQTSTTAEWVVYQVVEAAGIGLLVAVLLPAVQAKLSDADSGSSTATWSFMRSFGTVWGSSIPAAVFNNRFDQLSGRITDSVVRATLSWGHAYQHATKAFVTALPTTNGLREQVISVFSDSLKQVWQVGIAFVGLGFLLVFLEERVELRKELETEFGLRDKKGPKVEAEGTSTSVSES